MEIERQHEDRAGSAWFRNTQPVGAKSGTQSDGRSLHDKVCRLRRGTCFALPGGFFYEFRLITGGGQLGRTAGVMAHEIAHVAAPMPPAELPAPAANLLTSSLILWVGGIGYARREAVGIGCAHVSEFQPRL